MIEVETSASQLTTIDCSENPKGKGSDETFQKFDEDSYGSEEELWTASDVDLDEDFDEAAIQLVEQLNQKAGISTTILPDFSDQIFSSQPTGSVKKQKRHIDTEATSDPQSSSPTSVHSGVRTADETQVDDKVPSTAMSSIPAMTDHQKANKKTKSAAQNKKKLKKKTKLPPARPPPPPISQYDVRKTFARLLLNTFNSCDVKKLNNVLNAYCAEDVVAVHRYDGVKNPYGHDYTRVEGRSANINLWTALFKSAPDFFYDVLDANAYYTPDWKVIVASRFHWCGTRVADVRIARTTNERILEKKLFESSKYITDEQQLLEQLMAEKQRVIDDCALLSVLERPLKEAENDKMINNSSSTSQSEKDDVSFFKEESYFHTDRRHMVATDGDKFYIDPALLQQKRQMECVGTLFCELNDERKIIKMEFVFTSAEEKRLMIEQQQQKSSSSLEKEQIDQK